MATTDRCVNYEYDFCKNGTLLSCETILNETTYYYYYEYVCEETKVVNITVPVSDDRIRLFHQAYVDEPIYFWLLGCFLPALAIHIIFANILAISVFVRKSMRSATTIILVFLAFTDGMVCLTFLPSNFYHFTLGNYKTYVPYDFCVFDYVLFVMHRIFRTTSNWITVVLGIQRLIVVCYPFKAKRLCNKKTSAFSMICCLLFAFILHFVLTISMDIHRVPGYAINNVSMNDTEVPDGCERRLSSVLGKGYDENKTSLQIYFAFSGFFSRFLPCCVLVVVTRVLVYSLIKGREIRDTASAANKINTQARRISGMVLIVMFVVIITEMQDAVSFAIYIYELAADKYRQVLSKDADTRWTAYSIILSLIGYNLNFWIYILMSDQFRKEVWRTLQGIFRVLTCSLLEKDGETVTSILSSSNQTATTKCKTSSTIGSDYGRYV